jgi:hypothetical protein
LRFLAAAPLSEQNRNTLGRYEGMLKFITDRGNVSRAEIVRFFRDGIYALTAEKFNSIDFELRKYQKSYSATLSIDPKTSEYILNYGVYDNNEKKMSERDLKSLLTAMKGNTDFDARSIEQVETMAGLIPAVVYRSWTDIGLTKVDAVSLAAKTIADYYLNPTEANYNLVVGVFGLFNRKQGVNDPVANAGRRAYDNLLIDLNKDLRDRAYDDNILRGAALGQAAQARNPDYGVFTAQPGVGGY